MTFHIKFSSLYYVIVKSIPPLPIPPPITFNPLPRLAFLDFFSRSPNIFRQMNLGVGSRLFRLEFIRFIPDSSILRKIKLFGEERAKRRVEGIGTGIFRLFFTHLTHALPSIPSPLNPFKSLVRQGLSVPSSEFPASVFRPALHPQSLFPAPKNTGESRLLTRIHPCCREQPFLLKEQPILRREGFHFANTTCDFAYLTRQ
jgi:hypothetical protein